VGTFDEGFDVKLSVDGPSMTTSDTIRLLRKKTKGSQAEPLDTKNTYRYKKKIIEHITMILILKNHSTIAKHSKCGSIFIYASSV